MLIRPPLLMALLLALVAGPAALARQSTQERAQAFKLDAVAPAAQPTPSATPTPQPTPAPDAVAPAPALAQPSVPATAAVTTPAPPAPADAAAPAAPGLRATFTLDTPIGDLIGDPAAKAVLDKTLPGLSSDDNLDKFAKLGLRQFQPLTGGQLTDAMLTRVAEELSSLSGPLLAPIAPTAGGTSKRNRDVSR